MPVQAVAPVPVGAERQNPVGDIKYWASVVVGMPDPVDVKEALSGPDADL